MEDERWVRGASLVEGISYILLLVVAMPLKYGAGIPEAVRIAGMAHGVLFVALAALVAIQFLARRWSFGVSALVMAVALVPFGAVYLERRWQR
ncbi:MAG: DUF3817 domain-containing protein, partial [Myxococcota bacterium]